MVDLQLELCWLRMMYAQCVSREYSTRIFLTFVKGTTIAYHTNTRQVHNLVWYTIRVPRQEDMSSSTAFKANTTILDVEFKAPSLNIANTTVRQLCRIGECLNL
jgi:hypothetical protein